MPTDFSSLSESVARATRVIALVGLLGLLVIAGATIIDVLMRWLFNAPLDGLSDIGELVIVLMVAACFPAAIAGRHHITIRFLGKVSGVRGREVLDMFGQLMTLAFFTVTAWQLVDYVVDLMGNGQTTWLIGLPLWPSWTVAALLIVLCVPVQLVIVAGQVVRLRLAFAGVDLAEARRLDVTSDTLDLDREPGL
ncbi:MAG: TRAP transporter small permease [Alphaproteobacteria bacterium]